MWSIVLSAAVAAPLLTIDTPEGPVTVEQAYHGTLHLQVPATEGTMHLWVDPWSKAPELPADAPKADIVLLTDIHPDHLDLDALGKVHGPSTVVVAPQAVAAQANDHVDKVVGNGDTLTVAGIGITAVPMYNLERGPEAGKRFHDKGRGNGYVLDVYGTRVYIAGDTECTPEMKALKDIDHAFVPMNLPYTMPPEEAAACVLAFAPAKVTPIHYAGSDLSVFAKGIESAKGTTLVQIDAYPGGMPW